MKVIRHSAQCGLAAVSSDDDASQTAVEHATVSTYYSCSTSS